MKKDRLSCLMRSLRNQPPRTQWRYLKRLAGIGFLRQMPVGLRIKAATPPKEPYSVTYDLIITEEL